MRKRFLKIDLHKPLEEDRKFIELVDMLEKYRLRKINTKESFQFIVHFILDVVGKTTL